MPWQERDTVDLRDRFILAHQTGLYSMTELCTRFSISRKTGYKWLARYHEQGRYGLADRSRAPHTCPHRIDASVAQLLSATRRAHPLWGPTKVLDYLGPRHPHIDWPASSTIGDLFVRRPLVKKRRRRRPHRHPGVIPVHTAQPNDLWTTDFKGQFRTRDGLYCYPLTIADLHSRYLLRCQSLRSTKGHGVRAVFAQVFAEYGLPGGFGATMASPSRPRGSTGSRSSTCGGCGSAFNISASCRRTRNRTAPTSACTRP
jgi:putative transposase